MPPKQNASVYQLKITLKYIEPSIWRRVVVPSTITFAKLHQVIQVAMGWTDSHLHQFIVGDKYYGEADPEFSFEGPKIYSERSNRLEKVIPNEKTKFLYEYDYGDDWLHEIVVEKISKREPRIKYPVCLDGERHCPPEDCGGPPGYMDFLEALEDLNHPEHDEYLDWVGGDFDPEEFNVDEVNNAL